MPVRNQRRTQRIAGRAKGEQASVCKAAPAAFGEGIPPNKWKPLRVCWQLHVTEATFFFRPGRAEVCFVMLAIWCWLCVLLKERKRKSQPLPWSCGLSPEHRQEVGGGSGGESPRSERISFVIHELLHSWASIERKWSHKGVKISLKNKNMVLGGKEIQWCVWSFQNAHWVLVRLKNSTRILEVNTEMSPNEIIWF